MSHEKFPPELVSTLRAELDTNPGGSFESRQVLITGPMGITIWARTHGSKSYELSTRTRAHSSLPMGTLIVATTSPSEYATLDGFKVSDDSTYVDGDINNRTARFRYYNLEKSLVNNSYIRIPELGLIVGLDRSEIDSLAINNFASESNINWTPNENAVGLIITPIVETEDSRAGCKYHINCLGRTESVICRTTEEMGRSPGLYLGTKAETRLGELEDFLYSNQESLKKDIVLYTNKDDAARFVHVSALLNINEEETKLEKAALEREVIREKANTSVEDNKAKQETIKAKGTYEVNSAGRKDVSEDTSFTRNAILGSIAILGTVATVATKLNIKSGISGLIELGLKASVSAVVPCAAMVILAKALTSPRVIRVLSEAIKGGLSVVGDVLSLTCRVGSAVVGGICRAGVGLFRGVGRLLGALF